MSFQHLQLSEPVFGLFLSNAQHRAFLQTAERKHEGSVPRCTGARVHGCTGTRVHGHCGTQLTVYAKIQQLLLIFGLKFFAVKAQISSLKMICKAYECLQLVCLWRSIKLLFHSTRFLSFSNILMNIWGFVILQRLFFFSRQSDDLFHE